jgi:hypothetical protein
MKKHENTLKLALTFEEKNPCNHCRDSDPRKPERIPQLTNQNMF